MWQVGAARRELEMDFTGIELLGWGQPEGRIERVESALQVRAVALEADGQRLVYLCAELCFITQSLRDGLFTVLASRGIELAEPELVVAATHTHSGPAGFAHALFYNLSNPGHHPEVYACIVSTFADAVEAALSSMEPGQVWLNRGEIPLDEPVAFNRAIPSFLRNPDAPTIDVTRPETATNRDLTVLRVDGESGPRAAICWFACHNTNVHFDNRALHGDNKGVAASLFEDHAASRGHSEFVGIFAQGASGDVTPNYRPSKRGLAVGHHDDDFDSARFHGGVQMRHALELYEARGEAQDGLDTHATYLDFDGATVDPRFANGLENRTTGPARYGLGLIEGTSEGPGPLFKAQFVRRSLVAAVGFAKRTRSRLPGLRDRYPDGVDDIYGPMFPFIEAGLGVKGRAFGLVSMRAKYVPAAIDPVVHEIQRLADTGADLDSPWTPSVKPVHVAQIGNFALVSLPCEPTTTAGRRIAATVAETLGVQTVQVAGYSNAYHGYVTTREEYQVQAYEGAHTIFGQFTLAAYLTSLAELCADMAKHHHHRGSSAVSPTRFTEQELERRRYLGPPPKRSWG
ncbi:MAG: neutral/alkaline non-lysosomal ceramidase N-terminal domain-containing protein [Proteobacteria bacterium]|nr:neutral/alkaline non-lysosomal ceramidase N-terminal domain-containing protein [Pseudomonadota bacterium]